VSATQTSTHTAEEQIIAHLERDLRGLRDQGIVDAREITRLREANEAVNVALVDANNRLAAASRQVEQLLQAASIRLQGQTVEFNRIREIRDTLDPSVIAITNTPRAAAGAS
jgi:predicted RNase H-like nuclease (RuvC/YqgF family)